MAVCGETTHDVAQTEKEILAIRRRCRCSSSASCNEAGFEKKK